MKSVPTYQSPTSHRDDLALSHFIACAAHSVARSAQRELDLALAGIYLGTPLPEGHIDEVEKHWREARALAKSAREAYVRARARHEKHHAARASGAGCSTSSTRHKAA